MKKSFLIVLFISIFLISCGKSDQSKNKSPIGEGLELIVKNSLPPEQKPGGRVDIYHLNAYLCAPLSRNSNSPSIPIDVRCIKLEGVIENGTTKNFVISKKDLTRIAQQGKGQISFEFMDQKQLISIPYRCYTPNDTITPDSDFSRRQVWRVEINQRHSLSYGCIIDKL